MIDKMFFCFFFPKNNYVQWNPCETLQELLHKFGYVAESLNVLCNIPITSQRIGESFVYGLASSIILQYVLCSDLWKIKRVTVWWFSPS